MDILSPIASVIISHKAIYKFITYLRNSQWSFHSQVIYVFELYFSQEKAYQKPRLLVAHLFIISSDEISFFHQL